MRQQVRRPAWIAVSAFLVALALAACARPGDLSFVNDGDADATISTGDVEGVVPAGGGLVVLDYGCSQGDVGVTLGSGRTVTLPGPVCPDQEVVIRADDAALSPPSRP